MKWRPVEERFWEKVTKTDSCWLWTAHRTAEGYGRFRDGSGRSTFVHRWSYEQVNGSIPTGLVIDHLCKVRNCVNPSHLEAVTIGENNRRSPVVAGSFRLKSHCKHGHEFTPSNTYITPAGWRQCRECNRQAAAVYKKRGTP